MAQKRYGFKSLLRRWIRCLSRMQIFFQALLQTSSNDAMNASVFLESRESFAAEQMSNRDLGNISGPPNVLMLLS